MLQTVGRIGCHTVGAWLLAGLGVVAAPACSAGQRLLGLPYWEPAGAAAEQLAQQGADLTLTDDRGRTALHLAATWGDFEAALALVEHGAPLAARDQSGWTPLFSAVDETERLDQPWPHSILFPDTAGQVRIVRLLVERGADLEVVDINGYTPLSWAAECESYDKLDVLSELGADPEVPDPYGNTPLHGLAAEAAPVTVRLLVERGANVNAANEQGATPLHYAAGRTLFAAEVYQLMIEHGADPTRAVRTEPESAGAGRAGTGSGAVSGPARAAFGRPSPGRTPVPAVHRWRDNDSVVM